MHTRNDRHQNAAEGQHILSEPEPHVTSVRQNTCMSPGNSVTTAVLDDNKKCDRFCVLKMVVQGEAWERRGVSAAPDSSPYSWWLSFLGTNP